MAGTTVSSDVVNVAFNVAPALAVRERADSFFSDVLQKQSGTGGEEKASSVKAESLSRTKVEKSAKDRIPEKENGKAEKTGKENGEDETAKTAEEKALAAAEELAGQLLVQVADSLGISVDEAQNLLSELGMEPGDLLNGENLMQFFVAASGEPDSVSLLTNEELYAAFGEIRDSLAEGLEQIQMQTGLDAEELVRLVETADENVMDSDLMPAEENTILDGMEQEGVFGAKTEENVMVQKTNQESSPEKNENGKEFSQHTPETNAPFLMNQQNVAGTESAIPTEGYFSAETQKIMDQIMDFMKVNVGDEMSQLEMQLHPENLGTLQIHLSAKDGVVTAHFTTENEVVKEALESQMIELKETFREQGVKVETIEVSVQTNRFDRNLEQGRKDQSGENREETPKVRVRRLNLQNPEDISREELSDEDRLTAKLMEENGSTVDYTV